MITEANLATPQTKTKGEVRERTYQIHAARCTSRHRNREDHTLPRKKKKTESGRRNSYLFSEIGGTK